MTFDDNDVTEAIRASTVWRATKVGMPADAITKDVTWDVTWAATATTALAATAGALLISLDRL